MVIWAQSVPLKFRIRESILLLDLEIKPWLGLAKCGPPKLQMAQKHAYLWELTSMWTQVQALMIDPAKTSEEFTEKRWRGPCLCVDLYEV